MALGDEGVFRHLDHEALRKAGVLQRLREVAHEFRVAACLAATLMLMVASAPKVSLIRSIDLTISASTRWVSSSIQPEFAGQVDERTRAWITPSSSRSRTSASMPLNRLRPDVDLGLERAAEAFFQMASRSDCSIFIRARASRSMLESKKAADPLPPFLMRYIAMSAFWRSVSKVSAVIGIEADARPRWSKDPELSMKNGAGQPLQRRLNEFGDLLLALDRGEQQQEFVAGDARQHVGLAQVASEPLRQLDQQRASPTAWP